MTREDVIRRIVKRESQQESLFDEDVLYDDPQLHAAGCELFGTWETALRYAGVNFQKLPLRKNYSIEDTQREIRRLCRNHCRMTASCNARRNPGLYKAALKHFGTWKRAIKASGINIKNLRPFPKDKMRSRSQIAEMLILRDQQGLSLTWHDVSYENRALAYTAKLVFGSWSKAMNAAGISLPRRSRWSRQVVVEALQARHVQGLPLRCLSKHDRSLYYAARRYFGSVPDALFAAGLAAVDKGS